MDRNALDSSIGCLRDHANRWAQLPLVEKIAFARQALSGTVAVADRQVAAGLRVKALAPACAQAGEEVLAGPVVVARYLRLLIRSLEQVVRFGFPRLPGPVVESRTGGQLVAEVLPSDLVDRVLYAGFSAQVWMEPGLRREGLAAAMAGAYQHQRTEGAVALVLGAGNVPSIPPLDVIHKLFTEGQVCLLKMSPVNAPLGPFIEQAFAALVRAGYLQIAYGGADVGAYLCAHEGIDEIHITGSAATHDAIVFGSGADGEARKQRDEPVIDKRITSELGAVGPVIVMPGKWSRSALRYQAENIATQVANNAGFNCAAARVLITHADWPQRGALLDALREVFAALPTRSAYYPGAEQRYDTFVGAHAQAEQFGRRERGHLPWALIPGLASGVADDICFRSESFCGLLAETPIDGHDAADYLRNAVRFCNETLWGTLNAALIVDPKTARTLNEPVESAIADLRYGTVVVNHWPGLGFGLGSTTWGAYPGHLRTDIQSGVGVVHNAYLFDRPQKTVLRGPFVTFPKPVWFVTHRQQYVASRRLLAMEARPNLVRLPALAVAALRG